MKLADRKPTEFHAKVREPRVEACIKAREREVEKLVEACEWARLTATNIGNRLDQVDGDAPLTTNRELLDEADRLVTALRAHILTCRRAANVIHARDAREENGVLKP